MAYEQLIEMSIELLWAAYFCGIIALIVGYFTIDLNRGDKVVYRRIIVIWPIIASVVMACKLTDVVMDGIEMANNKLNK